MKKLIALLGALSCVLALVGCSNNQEEVETLFFCGEHEYFAIFNAQLF